MKKIKQWYSNNPTDASIVVILLIVIALWFVTGPHMSRSEALNTVDKYATSVYSYSNKDIVVERDTLAKYDKLNLACEVLETEMNYTIKILED